MTVRVYRSTDAGAPVLSGTAGSLIAVLDACLVNGYGTQVGSGWSKPFSGTNLAVYAKPSGPQRFLRIDDVTTTQYARAIGYEDMTGISTGTNPFPTGAQQIGGFFIKRSNVATSAARPWVVVATQTMFYLWVNHDDLTMTALQNDVSLTAFGDIISNLPGDTYQTMLSARPNTFDSPSFVSTPNTTYHSLCRRATGAAGAHQASITSHLATLAGSAIGGSNTSVRMPLPVTNQSLVMWSPVWVMETTPTQDRGRLQGCWATLNNGQGATPLAPNRGVTISPTTGPLAGKTLEQFGVSNGNVWLEISDTW